MCTQWSMTTRRQNLDQPTGTTLMAENPSRSPRRLDRRLNPAESRLSFLSLAMVTRLKLSRSLERK